MTAADFAADIPFDVARAAHAGASFDPEKRAEQVRAEYAATLQADLDNLTKYATTDEKLAALVEEFARYRAGYRRHYLGMLYSQSRVMSSMITGPSNFPTARNRKRGEAADKKTSALLEFRTRALAAIHKTLTPELAPIMSGDADALTRLKDKLAKLEARQVLMVAANKAIRKHTKAGADAQVAALVALGVAEPIARELLKPDFVGRVGFADYETKNNGAEIRRLKERLGTVETAQDMPDTTTEGTAARVEDCPAENRVRLFFPGKPAPAVCDMLSSRGFRWAPSLRCWSAYRNDRALAVAREVAGVQPGA